MRMKLHCTDCGALLRVSTFNPERRSIQCPKCNATVSIEEHRDAAQSSNAESVTLPSARSPELACKRRVVPNFKSSFSIAIMAFLAVATGVAGFMAGLQDSAPRKPRVDAINLHPSGEPAGRPGITVSIAAPSKEVNAANSSPEISPVSKLPSKPAVLRQAGEPKEELAPLHFIPVERSWLLAAAIRNPTSNDVAKPLQTLLRNFNTRLIDFVDTEEMLLAIDDRLIMMVSVARQPIGDAKIADVFRDATKDSYRGQTIYAEKWGLSKAPIHGLVADRRIVVFTNDLLVLKQTIEQSAARIRGSLGLPPNSYSSFRASDVPRIEKALQFVTLGIEHAPSGIVDREGRPLAESPGALWPDWAKSFASAEGSLTFDNGLQVTGSLTTTNPAAANVLASQARLFRNMLRAKIELARAQGLYAKDKTYNQVVDELLASDVTVVANRIDLALRLSVPNVEWLIDRAEDSLIVKGSFTTVEDAKPPTVPEAVAVRPTFTVGSSEITAGTAFAVSLPGHQRPLLLTAFHLFGPLAGSPLRLKSEDLPVHVHSVTLRNFDRKHVVGTAGPALSIPNAYGLTRDGDARGDLAAFMLPEDTKLSVRKLAEKVPIKGDSIWLVCLADKRNACPQRLVEGFVTESTFELLEYELLEELDHEDASGARLLNADGEVVGMHLGAESENDSWYGMANPTINIRKKLEAAVLHK